MCRRYDLSGAANRYSCRRDDPSESRQQTCEPLTGETADLRQSAGLLEEVSRSGNYVNTAVSSHSSTGLPVQFENDSILAPDDHQGRRPDFCQRLTREVGTAAAENEGTDRGGVGGRRQRSGSAGTGSEEAYREGGDFWPSTSPVHGCPNTLGEQRDVEPQLRRPAIDGLLRGGEQVQQEGALSRCVEPLCDCTVTRTVPAAPTAVCENHQSTRLLGYCQRASQTGLAELDGDVAAH